MANESQILGKPIDMECISVDSIALDLPLGTTNLQQAYNDPSYTPENYSTYAPMIYRCSHVGDRPYGSAEDPNHPWGTSYSVYSQLELLSQSVPSNTLGVYLGITNCSCYGADLPQPGPITWGNGTGLDNLIMDSLIAKSFGIKQITYFLDFDAMEDGYLMGSVFNSYGLNFLDIMNYWLNVKPPNQIIIYYTPSNAAIDNQLRSDWIYDFNQAGDILEFIGLWIGPVLILIGIQKRNTKHSNSINESSTLN